MLSDERWLPIPGYEGRYSVSSEGRVRNDRRGRYLNPSLNGPKRRQYPRVRLYFDKTTRDFFVHVLVMLAFEGKPAEGYEIDHVDNDPLNPRRSNLEYVTRSEQQKRAIHRDGRRIADRSGEKHHMTRLSWDQVTEIRRRLANKEISGRALAREMGLSPSAISDIATGRNWKVAS